MENIPESDYKMGEKLYNMINSWMEKLQVSQPNNTYVLCGKYIPFQSLSYNMKTAYIISALSICCEHNCNDKKI